MFVHEGFVDDFLASKKQGSGWDQVAGIAEGIFEKPNQLKWFLLLFKEPNDAMGVLKEFEHFMSLPIPAIKEFSPGNMSYWDVLQKFKKWEEQWRVKQDRYIHHAGAFRKEGREYSPMVVLDFKDGFVWMDLRTPYSEIESKAMGHCGNEPRSNTKDTILSLRQKIKRDGVPYFMPHATLVLMKNGFLRELKGYQNHKIASKYFPYVVELLKQHPRIKGIDNSESYKPSEDFYWYDLTPEQIDDIVRAKPVFSKDPVVKAMVQRYTGYVKKDRYNKYYMRDGRVEWGILPDDLGAPTLFFPSTSNGVFEISDPEILDRGTYYVRNGKFHREDGPAVIRPESPAYKHGEQGWYRDGNYYRENGGPHEEAGDGTKHWYTRNEYGEWKVDKVEHPDGSVDIWRDGRRVERRSPGGDSL